ncbi:hypothetical protein K445DRAFT_20069 [Daldinia sp. EC12]|nr:hypothetical protein K445DRAFT_20069 [Daldinia sp. EC12]
MPPSKTFDSEDWAMSISELPITLPPIGTPISKDDVPNDRDMGKGDLDTIFYVVLKSQKVPDKFSSRINELEEMLDLTHQWLDIHAGSQTKKRKEEGALPSDNTDESRWKRSDYRAKVVDTILSSHCAWIYNTEQEHLRHTIDVKKASFHLELLSNMLKGIMVPTKVLKKLEEGFKALGETIISTKSVSVTHGVWALFHAYTYDEAKDDMRATFRRIYYNITEDMYNTAAGKSSIEWISVDFVYDQGSYTFNEKIWNGVKGDIEKWIRDIAVPQIRNPIEDEVPV